METIAKERVVTFRVDTTKLFDVLADAQGRGVSLHKTLGERLVRVLLHDDWRDHLGLGPYGITLEVTPSPALSGEE